MKPYGLEALAALRIEKGHVAGLELDHRNTLEDLGLSQDGRERQALSSARSSAQRAALRDRPSAGASSGLECLEPGKRLRGGSILFSCTASWIEGHGRGYITSVTWSTVLEKFIALGLYQGGLKTYGRRDRVRLSAQGRANPRPVSSRPFSSMPQGERLRV